MRAVALFAVLVVGCGKKPATEPEPVPGPTSAEPTSEPWQMPVVQYPKIDPNAPPADGGQDMEQFTTGLGRQIPVLIDHFQKQGKKAIEYTRHPAAANIFGSVMLEVPRVYLTDAVTGKGAWYTRAQLTCNNPIPGSGLSYGWAKIEMLP